MLAFIRGLFAKELPLMTRESSEYKEWEAALIAENEQRAAQLQEAAATEYQDALADYQRLRAELEQADAEAAAHEEALRKANLVSRGIRRIGYRRQVHDAQQAYQAARQETQPELQGPQELRPERPPATLNVQGPGPQVESETTPTVASGSLRRAEMACSGCSSPWTPSFVRMHQMGLCRTKTTQPGALIGRERETQSVCVSKCLFHETRS